ncbi:MAG: hypothetical protein JRI91_00175 [Deltaproteobacteria bacterium]|nr:hypothetical protein [Deltaproteobacteria bacterium]
MNKIFHFILCLLLAVVLFPSTTYSSDAHKRETRRDERFIAYKNGTVMDTSTGLMWAAGLQVVTCTLLTKNTANSDFALQQNFG